MDADLDTPRIPCGRAVNELHPHGHLPDGQFRVVHHDAGHASRGLRVRSPGVLVGCWCDGVQPDLCTGGSPSPTPAQDHKRLRGESIGPSPGPR